jgi:hypothetical protein
MLTTVPDLLTFIVNTATIGVVALVVWFLIVGSIVWLGRKVVEKFARPEPEDASPDSQTPADSAAHTHC